MPDERALASTAQVQNQAWPLKSYVTLDKLLDLTLPSFSSKVGTIMATASEVMVRTAGIDQCKTLRTGPAQRKRLLNAPRGFCNVTPWASGGGTGCAGGFQGIERVREERRSLSTHCVACTSVTSDSLHLALTATLQGRHYHVPLPMKTAKAQGGQGVCWREADWSHFRAGLGRVCGHGPCSAVTALAQLLPCWCLRKPVGQGHVMGSGAAAGIQERRSREGLLCPGSDLYPLSNHLLCVGHEQFVPHYSFIR